MGWRESLESLKRQVESERAKMALLTLERDLLLLEEEMRHLQAASEIREELVYEAPYYWQQHSGHREGPFCQVCWDQSHRLIHLQQEKDEVWVCKVCANTFGQGRTSPFRYNPPF
jgi:hypothetical protein